MAFLEVGRLAYYSQASSLVDSARDIALKNALFSHYRIITKPAGFSNNEICEYQVNISGEPGFSTLKALVAYYLSYAILSDKDGDTDIFPWWITNNKPVDREDIYSNVEQKE